MQGAYETFRNLTCLTFGGISAFLRWTGKLSFLVVARVLIFFDAAGRFSLWNCAGLCNFIRAAFKSRAGSPVHSSENGNSSTLIANDDMKPFLAHRAMVTLPSSQGFASSTANGRSLSWNWIGMSIFTRIASASRVRNGKLVESLVPYK